MEKKEYKNRIRIILADKMITNTYLAEPFVKDPATISKWCTSRTQLGLERLREISWCLDIDIKDLLVSSN